MSPKIDIEEKLRNGYIAADDYEKSVYRSNYGGKRKLSKKVFSFQIIFVTLERIIVREYNAPSQDFR